MDNFRKSLIEELMLTLKIPQGNFNFATIASEIEFISNDKLRDFYKAVMTSKSYGNGMMSIIQTAKKFKEINAFEELSEEAKIWFLGLLRSGMKQEEVMRELVENGLLQ